MLKNAKTNPFEKKSDDIEKRCRGRRHSVINATSPTHIRMEDEKSPGPGRAGCVWLEPGDWRVKLLGSMRTNSAWGSSLLAARLCDRASAYERGRNLSWELPYPPWLYPRNRTRQVRVWRRRARRAQSGSGRSESSGSRG